MNSALQNIDWVANFKEFYKNLKITELAKLDSLYTADVRFADPIHRIEGRARLHRYFETMCGNLIECKFNYLDEMVEPSKAYIKWDMTFRHPNLKSRQLITVRGATQILFSDNGIHYHEDFYDLGAMLYEHIPLLGSMANWIKKRLKTP